MAERERKRWRSVNESASMQARAWVVMSPLTISPVFRSIGGIPHV